MTPLPALDLARLRAAEQKATHGPWKATTNPHPEAVRRKTEAATISGPDCRVYTIARDYTNLPETWARQCADAELIALSRNALPALIAHAARLAELAELRKQIETMLFSTDKWCDDGRHCLCVNKQAALLRNVLALLPAPPSDGEDVSDAG